MTANPFALHEALNVYISADAYTFEPASAGPAAFVNEKASRQCLRVDRRTGDMRLESEIEDGNGGGEMVITCYGIVGYITLATSKRGTISLFRGR
jgi:hypothetical protein